MTDIITSTEGALIAPEYPLTDAPLTGNYYWCYASTLGRLDTLYFVHATTESPTLFVGEYFRFVNGQFHAYVGPAGTLSKRGLNMVPSHEREWTMVWRLLMLDQADEGFHITRSILFGKFPYHIGEYYRYHALATTGWTPRTVLHVTEAYPSLIVCQSITTSDDSILPIYRLAYGDVLTERLDISYEEWVRGCLCPDILLR